MEDHPDTRRFLGDWLRRRGYWVVELGSVQDALAALATGSFDVLISDIGLPDGSGWDLLQRAPRGHVTHAIAMSGYTTHADRAKSLAAGYRHHLQKPFTIGDLKLALASCANSAA